jgi:hypothetical protein
MEHMQHLLNRVSVSFGRLATMAPTLDEGGILDQTTNTLDVYAEYTQHLSSPNLISYSDEVKSHLEAVRQELSRLFLDLRRGQDARAAQDFSTLMHDDLRRLSVAVKNLSEQIVRRVRVQV